MSKSANIDPEWIDLAWKQASLIHRSNKIIDRIISDAYSKLSLTATKQKKRRYPKTKEREAKRIYLEKIHLFQRLVFLESEVPEKDQEIFAPDSISEGDMIIRYLALIVRKIMRRNSLYALTGVCRFICNYSFKDVRTIHDCLVDENGHKDADEYRKNKQSMLKMIMARFQDYLRLEETQNWQGKNFIRRKDQGDSSLIRLVKETLDAFKPWQTECLSACFAPHDVEHNVFAQQADYDVLELRRLHTLIHQDCLNALTKAKDLDAPDTKLGIPQFFFGDRALSGGDFQPPSGDGGGEPSSKDQMLEELRKRLTRQDERLWRFVPQGEVIVRIDGREAASFNLDLTSSVQFTVDDEDAEQIEIIARSEQLVLAVHLLEDEVWQTQDSASLYEVRHPNGMTVIFKLRQITDDVSHQDHLSVTVTYKETDLRRSLSYWARRLRIRISSWKPVPELSPEPQPATEAHSQAPEALEALAPARIGLLARYYSNDRLLRSLLVLLLVIACSSYTAVLLHTQSAAMPHLRLEFWGFK